MGKNRPLSTNLLSRIDLPERYAVVRHLANGGMASVWCADDLVLGRRVAIKVLAEQYEGDESAIRRFKREARTQARLSGHPHIVTVYDVGERGGRAFIVMEYLPGGTVADALRAGAVRRDEALRWLREAAGALDYAHQQEVVHRDIKPGNLLLAPGRSVHVGDFGIARVAADDTITTTGQLLGTAAYIAPEQVMGRPATAASDRYAFAVTAFELLTGARPFRAEHFAAQARQHIEEEPPRASERNPSLPGQLDPVLAKGMAKSPEQRWPTAVAFVEAVEGALGAGGPTLIRTPLFGGAPSRRRSPRRAGALGALAAAALAAAAVAAATSGGGAGAGAGAHRQTHPARSAHVPPVAPKHPSTPHHTAVSAAIQPAAVAPDAAGLEARGHALMLAGDYGNAIPVLRQAVAAADPSSITYAYALYDLGRSLRLAGDPQAAIPILMRRLQIPNQTGVVRQELLLASRAAATGTGGAPASPSAGNASRHGNGQGGGGD